jgi:hypothetical protein
VLESSRFCLRWPRFDNNRETIEEFGKKGKPEDRSNNAEVKVDMARAHCGLCSVRRLPGTAGTPKVRWLSEARSPLG